MEVLTPSYGPDFELCRDLNRSVLRHGPADVVHRIVVPRRDRHLFAPMAGRRTVVELVTHNLPGRFVPVPGANMWMNVARPLPPVRGWIAQQIVKLEATARSAAELVVVADSDLVFVRPFSAETFSTTGQVDFYRLDGAIDDALPRHVVWHRVARRLLGLIEDESLPKPDYVCWPCAWEPPVVREMLARIESEHRRAWQTMVGSCLHFSEMILYGVYVDALMPDRRTRAATSSMPCLTHPDEIPLDEAGVRRFVERLPEDAVAVMISAKSGTSLGDRRRGLERWMT